MGRKKNSDLENEPNEIIEDTEDNFEQLAALTGGELLDNISSIKYFIDTGNLALNWVCSGKFYGGGIPAGKIVEIYGPASSGKSLWGTNILKGTQDKNGVAVYLDCENALSKDFAQTASHVDLKKIIRYAPRSLESSFLKIYNVIKAVRKQFGPDRPLCIVYDSITVSPCERELRETDIPENYTPADWKSIVGGKEQPGERAKICNKEFRKLEVLLETSNTTLFIINQIRYKIGVMFGDNRTTGAGSTCLEYYSGCRLESLPAKRILNGNEEVIGVKLNIKNTKNRCVAPFKKAMNINLFFEKGVDPTSGLLTTLLQINRIRSKKGGYYQVDEKFTNGEEVIFRTSLEKGIVPLEILYQYPGLIDAPSEDVLKDYLTVFTDAIEESNNVNNVEKSMEEEL